MEPLPDIIRGNRRVVMPALVAGIHVLETKKNVDGRDKPGHDGGCFRLNG